MFTKRPIDYWLLWGVALSSLILNLVVINALLNAQKQVGQAARAAAVGVSKLRAGAIDYNVHIDQQIPVNLNVTYSETVSVPISATVPINAQISTVLQLPLIGAYPLSLPVNTTVPISLTQKIPINLAIPVNTTVPIVMDVPIHIEFAETALGASLVDVENYLNQTAEQMGAE